MDVASLSLVATQQNVGRASNDDVNAIGQKTIPKTNIACVVGPTIPSNFRTCAILKKIPTRSTKHQCHFWYTSIIGKARTPKTMTTPTHLSKSNTCIIGQMVRPQTKTPAQLPCRTYSCGIGKATIPANDTNANVCLRTHPALSPERNIDH